MSSDNLMDASHPGEIDIDDFMKGNEKAIEWYEQAVRYTARLCIESAQRHPEVRESLMQEEDDLLRTLSKHDKENHEEIDDLGLSSYQALSAEQLARQRLDD